METSTTERSSSPAPFPPLPSQLPLGPFPENEAYDYLIITLPNHLTCLLISTHREDLNRRASWYSMGTDIGGGGTGTGGGHEKEEEKKQVENLASRLARLDTYAQISSSTISPPEELQQHGRLSHLGSSRRRSTMMGVVAAAGEGSGRGIISDSRGNVKFTNHVNNQDDPSSNGGGGGAGRDEPAISIGDEEYAPVPPPRAINNASRPHSLDESSSPHHFPLPISTSGRHTASSSAADSSKRLTFTMLGGDSNRHVPLASSNAGIGVSNSRQSFYSNASEATKRGNSYLAAAALCVGVGNFSDPGHVQGLAHVVEHMVFMGSQAFPAENDWDQFMAVAGGQSNASTEAERTTFHFSLPRESFEEGLDRFTHFFIDPLLHKESLDKELAAINSEFHDSASEPNFLLGEVMGSCAKPGPFQQFACGSAQSLETVENLHEYLTSFFNTHYVAQNMTAVLYSADTMDNLIVFAQNTFGRIPNARPLPVVTIPPMFNAEQCGYPFLTSKEIQSSSSSIPKQPGRDGFVNGCCFLIDPPPGHPHVLQITWQLPSQRSKWKSKSIEYIGNAIGHETNGSVLKECKARGWANGLMCTGDATAESSGLENNSAVTLFQVFVILTELGVLEYTKVIELVFEYIGMLIQHGIQKVIYEELRKCSLAAFLFRDVPSPALYVEALAQRLCANSKLPHDRVVNGSELYFEFDEDGIREILASLTPENAKYELVTRLVRLCPPELWESHVIVPSSSQPSKDGSIIMSTDDSVSTNIKGSGANSIVHVGGGYHLSAALDVTVDKTLAKKLKRHVFGPFAQQCNYMSYKEPWYGTLYAGCVVPSNSMHAWELALRRGTSGASHFAKLPSPNEYICEDFYVKELPRPTLSTGLVGFTFDLSISNTRVTVIDYDEKEALMQSSVDAVRYWVPYNAHCDPPTINNEPFRRIDGVDIQVTRASDAPALVQVTPYFSLWHLQGGQFTSSRCELHIALEFPRALIGGHPIDSAMADLLLILFQDATVTETYPAFLSGTYMDCEFIDGNKFVFMYSGFPSSVQLLVERTLPIFLGCAKQGIGEIAHRNQKVLLSAQIEALMAIYTNDDEPFCSTLDSVLRLDSVDSMHKREALEKSITRAKLHKFAITAVSQCRATALYYGNCDRRDCAALGSNVDTLMRKHLGSAKALSNGRRPKEPARPTFRVPGVSLRSREERDALGGTRLSGLFSLFTASGPSSSVLVYMQIAAPSITHRQTMVDVKTRLICELMVHLMKEPLFNSLRTQKKLAYHVTCGHHEISPPGIQGIYFEIQSHHCPTLTLVDVVDDFLIDFEQELNKLPTVEFERHVRALCLRKMERDVGPSDEARRHFTSILNGQVNHGSYAWNRDKEDSKLLLAGLISKEDVIDFFDTYLNPDFAPSRRRLNLLVMGGFEVKAGGYEVVVNKLREIDNAHILGPSDGFMIMQSIEKNTMDGARAFNKQQQTNTQTAAAAPKSSAMRVIALSPGGVAEFVPIMEEEEEEPPPSQKKCWFWWF